ncbi:MAG: FKBP-type peptidyl-prolyl cis-trans isomerase [Treponema sp.]|jgi:FKBP-type peptidyl-prolyl cis-trans isomerase FkpA|nr:FKBP-type peptidyl-prolyl cis-trans isomerase [Treponema sp.]
MKKIVLIFCLFVPAFILYGKGIAEEVNLADEREKISYAFGLVMGSDLKQAGLEFNYPAFTEGFKTGVEAGEAPYTLQEAIDIVQTAFEELMARNAETNRIREIEFLEENGGREGVITTESGLQYEILSGGTGEKPSAADTVRVNYEGALTDGTVFDSSYERGEAAEFPLGRVIPGWTEGLQLMRVGSSYRFYIPSALAYGGQGAGQVIPAYATLVFTVELLEITGETDAAGEDPGDGED